jgi:hypothetical protein
MRCELFGALLLYCSNKKLTVSNFSWFGPQIAVLIEFAAQIMKLFEFADFFLVQSASHFTLRTFSALIN